MSIKADFKIDFLRNQKREAKPPIEKVGRVPRLARIVALAIHLDGEIAQGKFENYTQIALAGGITTTRISQIMNHLLLAPDIIEEILFLPKVTSGRDPIPERAIRPLLQLPSWREQRETWTDIKRRAKLAINRDWQAHAEVSLV
jgi:hypothetical protein